MMLSSIWASLEMLALVFLKKSTRYGSLSLNGGRGRDCGHKKLIVSANQVIIVVHSERAALSISTLTRESRELGLMAEKISNE